MKQKTCFINLHTTFNKAINVVWTETKCGNIPLINLKKDLNEVIKSYMTKDATALTCAMLWKDLTGIVYNFKYKPCGETEIKFKNEILDSIFAIGMEIAFISPRKSLDRHKAFQDELDAHITLNTSTDEMTVKDALTRALVYDLSLSATPDELEKLYDLYNQDEYIQKRADKYIADNKSGKGKENLKKFGVEL